jgi:quinol monooxygenase YgiN
MKLGLLARIEARPEHAEEVATMLAGATQLAEQEGYAVTWYTYRADATTFGVFDTFTDEAGRSAHLHGKIAAALQDAADTGKLVAPADIRPVDLLGAMVPGLSPETAR